MDAPWKPVSTRAELEALDQDSMLEGYRAGLGFIPVNHTKTDQGYWHGYESGQIDRGLIPISPERQQLGRELLETGYFRSLFGNTDA